MFYCNSCGQKNGWPVHTITGSYGPCEICHEVGNCNDVPSKHLPAARRTGDN